jgi:hypothetical protein
MDQRPDTSREPGDAAPPQDRFVDHGAQPPADVWGVPAAQYADARETVDQRPRPRSRRALATVALATGLVVGGAAVAAAVSGTAGSAVTGAATQAGAVSGSVSSGALGAAGGLGAHGGGRGVGGVGGALHGELTVPQTDGTGTRVVLVQTGAVTAVSSSRLSIRSTDGFTATYPVDASTQVRTGDGTTIADVTVGDTVSVMAAKGGAALMVVERGARDGTGRKGWGDRDGRSTPSTPTPSPTTSGASA